MFKNQLKFYRKQLDMNQQQIADKIGVTRQCYALYEQGRREPSIELIKKLCVIFDCTADELLEIDTDSARKKININNSFNGSRNINFKM